MMKIDGYDVKPGDKLWHVVLGEGTVTEITPENAIRVTFGAANHLFDKSFKRVGERVRTLYWQNPVLMLPPPVAMAQNWTAVREICTMVASKVLRLNLQGG